MELEVGTVIDTDFYMYLKKYLLTVDLENSKVDDLVGMDYSSMYWIMSIEYK